MSGEGWAEPWVFPLPWPPLADNDRRIGLRPWGAGANDSVALAAAWADADIARWCQVPEDRSAEAAKAWIRGEERRRAQGAAMDLVVVDLGDAGTVLGEVGVAMADADKRWAELGFWITPSARGAGRARAAASIFVTWALRELPVNRIFARTSPENPAAGVVASAAGLTHVGNLESGTMVWVRDRGQRL